MHLNLFLFSLPLAHAMYVPRNESSSSAVCHHIGGIQVDLNLREEWAGQEYKLDFIVGGKRTAATREGKQRPDATWSAVLDVDNGVFDWHKTAVEIDTQGSSYSLMLKDVTIKGNCSESVDQTSTITLSQKTDRLIFPPAFASKIELKPAAWKVVKK
ncbi:hypothetical protein CDD80_809 [Ophiocordyceps camponoti-rufipedis]|uniref:Cyanovirin-N domain-containing protein n=1 Tax=Ophiocordyceps camponoti-rufipedis TaxID=2004952 RepID=A0A2C5ZBE7_9HYPO|nr:hypothetical protein CDD80_809 [Ophiocordyceps camponoti-rufipedis]